MKLSIVIPVYNSERCIEHLVSTIIDSFNQSISFEVILINDCSTDTSWSKLYQLKEKYHHHISIINLAKNVGENNAVMAGLRAAKGEYIIQIDDDFQNPPSEIIPLLQEIEKGYDVVYAQYARSHHGRVRKFGSYLHSRLATKLFKLPTSMTISTFRIITKNLKNEILNYKGPKPYVDALILRSTSHIGTRQVKHHPSKTGQSNYTISMLGSIWLNMFFLSAKSLGKLIIYYSLIHLGVGFISLYLSIKQEGSYLISVPHQNLLTIGLTLIVTSNIIIILGIITEYLSRIYHHQTQAPQYFIRDILRNK